MKTTICKLLKDCIVTIVAQACCFLTVYVTAIIKKATKRVKPAGTRQKRLRVGDKSEQK